MAIERVNTQGVNGNFFNEINIPNTEKAKDKNVSIMTTAKSIKNEPIYGPFNLDEVVVTAQKPSKEVAANQIDAIDAGVLDEVVVTAKNKKAPLNLFAWTKKPSFENDKLDVEHADKLLMAKNYDGKIIKREVNGQKQEILVCKDKNGRKHRFAVNADGSVGERLIAIDTRGKNEYMTYTEYAKAYNLDNKDINYTSSL